MTFRINHIHLESAYLGESTAWFWEAFGFRVVSDDLCPEGDRFIRRVAGDSALRVNFSDARTGEVIGDAPSGVHYGIEHFGMDSVDIGGDVGCLVNRRVFGGGAESRKGRSADRILEDAGRDPNRTDPAKQTRGMSMPNASVLASTNNRRRKNMKSFKITAAIAFAGSLMATTALAQEWPSKPITYIIPYGAGGTSDIGARTWGPYMEACLGATFVFVNRPGAGGEVGFAELASSAPDGYTWGALNVPNSPLGAITKDSPSYTMDDFVLLGNMYGSIVSINAKRGGEFETLADLVEAAKTRQVNVGISNLGSDDHTKMMAFWNTAGVQATYIPLADAANSRNAVIGGHVDASGNSFTEVVTFQEELVTLAIASPERRPELPDVPTFRELGYDVVGGSSHVIGAPSGTPQEIVDKIDACFQTVGQNPAFLAEAAQRNLLIQQMNHQEVTEWLAAETELLRQLWEEHRWVSQ